MVKTTENDFLPIYLCLRLHSPSDLHKSELPFSHQLPPPSPPCYTADGGVKEVAAVPKEVFGVSMQEVSHNAMVTMAIFIGSLGLKKHFDSSLVTELKIAPSQELVFS